MKQWVMGVCVVMILATAFGETAFKPKETGKDKKVKHTEESLWSTDYAASLAKAKAEGKYLLVDFSGSDWCGWCMKLDEEVFSQKRFKSFAEKNFILVLLDFPRTKPQAPELKAQNAKLSQQFGVTGFPTVLILNPEGKVVEKTGYRPGGASDYEKYLKSVLETDKKNAPAEPEKGSTNKAIKVTFPVAN